MKNRLASGQAGGALHQFTGRQT